MKDPLCVKSAYTRLLLLQYHNHSFIRQKVIGKKNSSIIFSLPDYSNRKMIKSALKGAIGGNFMCVLVYVSGTQVWYLAPI